MKTKKNIAEDVPEASMIYKVMQSLFNLNPHMPAAFHGAGLIAFRKGRSFHGGGGKSPEKNTNAVIQPVWCCPKRSNLRGNRVPGKLECLNQARF